MFFSSDGSRWTGQPVHMQVERTRGAYRGRNATPSELGNASSGLRGSRAPPDNQEFWMVKVWPASGVVPGGHRANLVDH